MTEEQVRMIERESERARWNAVNRRLWILCLVLTLLLAGCVGYVIYLKNEYQSVTEEEIVEQVADEGGENHYIGGDVYGDAEN